MCSWARDRRRTHGIGRAVAAGALWVTLGCSSSEEGVAAPGSEPGLGSEPTVLPERTAAGTGEGGSGEGGAAPGVEPSASTPSEGRGTALPIAGGATGDQIQGNVGGAGGGASPGGAAAVGDMPAGSGQGGASPTGELPNITVWLAGDSTVANGLTPCPRGWGGVFQARFDDRVKVNNAAVGGRSVRTWLYDVLVEMEGGECALRRDATGNPVLQQRWQTMLEGMKSGDYLFIQFGINDGDSECNRHVGIEAFKESYGMMAEAAKERGTQPIFVTPVSSIACNGNIARGSRGGFVPATAEVGLQFDVPVIDLHARSVALYQSRGFCPVAGGDVSANTTGPVGDFFCDDHTHFSAEGALDIAGLMVEALREQGIPLAAYLR